MTLFQNFTVLRDELLPVRELSTFHSVQLSISSYGLKTFSHRPKLLFDFLWEKVENHENQILGTKNSSGWVLTLVRTFRMKFQTFCHMIKNTISTLVEKNRMFESLFCLKLTSFWLDLSLTKKGLFSWWEFSLTKNGFFICWLFFLVKLILNENGLFLFEVDFFLDESYL